MNDGREPLLVNDGTRPRSKLSIFFYYKRNPLFFASLAMVVFAAVCAVLHAIWGFTAGTAVALVALVVGAWLAAAIVDHQRRDVRQLDSWSKLKGVFFLFFFAGVYTGLTLIMVKQLQIYLAPSAADPQWSAFPLACRPTDPNFVPSLNCVRAGLHVPNATHSVGQPVPDVPLFATRLDTAVDALIGIMNEHHDLHDCHLIKHVQGNGTHFLHYRCLSIVVGFPDDFAAQLTCDKDSGRVRIWFHSQSRLSYALWDHGVNDARIRLVLQYMQLPTDWWPWANMMRTNETCTAKA